MRVAIYPDVFDPIQDGHVALTNEILSVLDIDRLFLLVEPRPRNSQALKSVDHRVSMTQLAIENEERLGVIAIEGARFFIERDWPKIATRFSSAGIFMILTENKLNYMINWPQESEASQIAPEFIICTENMANQQAINNKIITINQHRSNKLKATVLLVNNQALPQSEIKANLRRGLINNLNDKVVDYITKNGLYKSF